MGKEEFIEHIKESVEGAKLLDYGITQDGINHRLATEVMGWEIKYFDGKRPYRRIGDGDTYEPIDINGSFWNPSKDLNQAMMCVEKITKYWFVLTNHRNEWEAMFRERDVPAHVGVANEVGAKDKSPALAICLAIMEALNENVS